MSISLVPSDDRVRRFTATGGETVFPVSFPFFSATDLLVQRVRAGSTTTLTLGTDYSVTGGGAPAGGTVTLAAPALAGDLIVIASAQPVARTSEWTDGQALTARALNAEFARWWIAAQQLARDSGQAVRVPISEPPLADLPPAATRANKFLTFDSEGQPIVSDGPSIGGITVSAFSGGLLGLPDAPTWRNALSVPSTAGVAADLAARVAKTGDTMTGPLDVAAGASNGIRVAGDTDTVIVQPAANTWSLRTGGLERLDVSDTAIVAHVPIVLPGDPAIGAHAATKQYVDNAVLKQAVYGPFDLANTSSVLITNLPDWVRRIEVWLYNVTGSDSNVTGLRLGTSSGIVTTGYTTVLHYFGTGVARSIVSTTFGVYIQTAPGDWSVRMAVRLVDANNGTWAYVGHGMAGPLGTTLAGGRIAISNTVDRVELNSFGSAWTGGRAVVEVRG